MKTQQFTRRQALQATALLGTSLLLPVNKMQAMPMPQGKTPALTPEEIAAIESALGKKGSYKDAESVHTTPLPRNDLKITIKGAPVPISFGFGGWVSFKKSVDGKSAMIMGDTVLLQEEVNPLISAAQANGLEISAIHNHFFYEEPRIFYMHIQGMGSIADLAKRYADTIRDSKIFPANQPASAAPPAITGKENFDIPALDAIVKYTGTVNGPTYKYTIGRSDLKVMMMGVEMTTNIGLNTWASFAGKQDDAQIAGDIAMLPDEVNSVIKTLRLHNLEVVAVHSHMLNDARISYSYTITGVDPRLHWHRVSVLRLMS
ncbi:LppY/LpqO family protein [uncultured Mucilaginibacter sp.]|uniref:LppY/LpqO family protein n=1 Tax=uncultured Mucilaginibacter sp. TaxID=797541 RepID=UPI0025DAE1AE|nr:LppY/LpqO family protein [uncultured Mucilaginibacter sp.]